MNGKKEYIECPHCGKTNKVVLGKTIYFDIENDHNNGDSFYKHRCVDCGEEFLASEHGSKVITDDIVLRNIGTVYW